MTISEGPFTLKAICSNKATWKSFVLISCRFDVTRLTKTIVELKLGDHQCRYTDTTTAVAIKTLVNSSVLIVFSVNTF